MTRRPRRWLVAACAVVALAATPSPIAQTPPDAWADFPIYERALASLMRRGDETKRARRQPDAAAAPPETIARLMQGELIADAIKALPAALSGDADRIVGTLRALTSSFSPLLYDDTRDYREVMRKTVEPVRARVAAMPREDAARVAFALLSFDNWIGRGGSRDWDAQVADFVTTYAGTEAALLAQIDLLSSAAPRQRSLEPLERFWREHPGTIAGAKALYQIGFHLHTINMLEPRGGDPTERLLRVAGVVRELESGRYPASEWVEKAPSLMTGFFIPMSPGPTFAPGNVERALEAFERFVLTHFDARSADVDNGIGYLIASKMPDLYERQGDRIGGVEALLARLEKESAHPQTARRLRATFYLRQWTAGAEPIRAGMGERARAAFAAIAAGGRGGDADHALATLASMAFYERDYARAIPLYRQYLETYPDSAFAWVAALRLGQCFEAQTDWMRAAETHERSAASFASAGAPAVVLANTFAARSLDAIGEPVRALEAYRRAAAAWDPDYGERYSFSASQQPLRTSPPVRVEVRSDLVKTQLLDRIATLEGLMAVPGGALLERGNWLLAERRFGEAEATFARIVKEFPKAAIVPVARSRGRLVQLERAIDLAGIEGGQRDDPAAMKLLDALAGEQADFAVGAADIGAATLLFKDGATDRAAARMQRGLDRLAGLAPPAGFQPPAAALDADIAAIRALVFRPAGDLPQLNKPWNAFTFPGTLPPFVIVRPDVSVKIGIAAPIERTVYQRFPDMPKAILMTRGELAVLARLLNAMGGTRTREPRQVMETPHQPAGPAVDILGFWNRFFPARGGHWGGWVLETYPIIHRIEFLDEARTKANVAVEVGYAGGTLVLEKINGAWKVIRLTNEWIT